MISSQSGRQENQIRMVVSDLDGTLLDPSKKITPRAEKVVSELHARGIDFSVCSGRPARGMLSIVEETAISLPYGALNGGIILSSRHEVLHEKRLSFDHAEQTLAYFFKAGIAAWLFTSHDWFILKPNERDSDSNSEPQLVELVDHEARVVGFAPIQVESFSPYLDSAVKIVGVSQDHKRLEEMEGELKEHLAPAAFASRSNLNYLDVTHAQANKGEFIQWLSSERGIRNENILSIGDMPCDAEMFRYSGIGIAMGSSPDVVKEQASYVTAANDADGFARALEEHVLGQ